MKKFSVPVSYYEISRFSTERHYVETRFEVESESIETLLDDLRCSRIRVPLTLSDDEDILNLNSWIMNLDKTMKSLTWKQTKDFIYRIYLQKWSDLYEKIFSTSKLRSVGSS